MHYVYMLADPLTKRVRYVGVSSKPKTRLGQHVNTRGRPDGNARKRAWVDGLLGMGQVPMLIIFQKCATRQEALNIEMDLIWSMPGLFNKNRILHRAAVPI